MSKKERAKESARLIIKIIVQGMLNEDKNIVGGF